MCPGCVSRVAILRKIQQGLDAGFRGRMRGEDAQQALTENGFMMNMCAVAGLASSGTRLATASIFLSASTSP